MKKSRIITLLLCGLLCTGAKAQFYTGSGMNFGRKRVQYEKFIWMYYRFDGFDIYFTTQGKNLALYTASYVQNHLSEMEERMGFQAQESLRFIVFNRLTDLKQSNIGYLDETTETTANTGGITRFLDNKIFLYFEGDYLDFERQIRRGIAELLVNQAVTGVKVGSQYRNSYVMDLPRWFTGGAASYFSRDWDEEMDEKMAVAVRRRNYRYFGGLEGEDAAFAGHSFWRFVAETYGEDAVSRCIRAVSSEKNLKKTFRVALGEEYKKVMDRWFQFYLDQYSDPLLHGAEEDEGRAPPPPRAGEGIWRAGLPARSPAEGAPTKSRTPINVEEALPHTNRPDHVYQGFILNPKGKEAAFVSNHLGRAKVYLQTHGRRFCIYRTGASINDNPDYSFPLLCFHPDGKKLALMVEEKGRTTLIMYQIEHNARGEFRFKPVNRHHTRYRMDAFDKVKSFSFSPDGRQIALAATLNGYPDIFTYRLGAGTRQQITFDLYDDYDPVWVPGTDLLVFASNRPNDSLKKGEKFAVAPSFRSGRDLFAYNLKKPSEGLYQMTQEEFQTIFKRPQVWDAEKGMLVFTNNRYGQTNITTGQLGKTISHIDTAIHYRHTFTYDNRTDWEPGLQFLDAVPERGEAGITGQAPSDRGRFLLGGLDTSALWRAGGLEATPSKFKSRMMEQERKRRQKQAYQDSLRRAAEADTTGRTLQELERQGRKQFPGLRNASSSDRISPTAFDILLYQRFLAQSKGSDTASLRRAGVSNAFSGSGPGGPHAIYGPGGPYSIDSLRAPWDTNGTPLLLGEINLLDTLPKIPPKQHMYNVEYMVNSSIAQLGFDYLNACYQQYTGGKNPLYLNSTASGFTQISITDLMENHRLIGGFSFSLDFSTTEYLFSYEYLERRLGHQLILHMSNIKSNNSYEYPYRQNTYDIYYLAKYPLTPVLSLRGTVFGRYDRSMFQTIDYTSLISKTSNELRLGLKGELVYDHSRLVSQNIYYGTRGKVWIEYYQGVLNNKQNLFVAGLDIRDYRRLFKTLIWANRLAYSTSFGQQKLIYYMGGVDSWVGARFNKDVEVDPNQNYAYQTLATNMRGFTQNIRNGNTFAVINSEIRFPFVQVLSRRPVQSSFLRHLQLVAFADIGSAWSGWNPWDKKNPFYTKVLEGKTEENPLPLTITLEKDIHPIVGGFGVGLRIQLFGYFLRGDLAWGVENGLVHRKPVFYFSLSTDF